MGGTGGMAAAAQDRAAVEDFLFHEADLIDGGRWEEWLALFTDDAWYWVPARPGQPDPINELSLIYDDIATLQVRVARMRHPAHHANQPVVRSAHHISNIRITRLADDGCTVASRLLMVDQRGEIKRLFSARVEHGLRLVESRLFIASKKVELLDADLPHEELVVPF